MSIKLLADAHPENESAPVYIMDVKGDYYFDDFINKDGATNDGDLINFVIDNITKGVIPVNIASPDIGYLSFTVWSALYNLTNKTVKWVSNEEFENENSIFSFDFSYL